MKKATGVSIAAFLAVMMVPGVSADDKGRMEEYFSKADTNKDGKLTHAEMMVQVRSRFDGFDKNGNGFIELGELPKVMPVPEGRQKRGEKRRAKMKERMAERGREISEQMKQQFEKAGKPTRIKFMAKHDRDGDERISLDEFSSKAARRFKRGDMNGDGVMTMAELEEAKVHHMKKRIKNKHKKRDGRS